MGAQEKIEGDAESISGLQVIDAHTLGITIDAPKSDFLAKLTYPAAFCLDQLNVNGNPKNWFRHPNGTGPFKSKRYDVGETLLLTRNDDYHRDSPKLAEVDMTFSGGTGMLMYENNEIHITRVGLADLDRLLDTNNALNAELRRASPQFSIQYIGLNVNEPPLDDPKVRQALNLAIDKQEIATIVLGDQVVPATGILPTGFPGNDPDLKGYAFDPKRAQQLLAESKYGEDPENAPPIIMTSSGSFGAAVDLDMLFFSESSNNHTNYNSPEVDAIVMEARTEPNKVDRYELYNQAEKQILEEAP